MAKMDVNLARQRLLKALECLLPKWWMSSGLKELVAAIEALIDLKVSK